ncbi:MAG: carbohydrate porin, partial [Xanthobacteraceae bacterium]
MSAKLLPAPRKAPGAAFSGVASLAVLLAATVSATAADVAGAAPSEPKPAMPVKARPAPASPAYDWSGWYVGAHVGFTAGRSAWTATPAGAPPLGGSLDFPLKFDLFACTGSYVEGLQGGYNYVLPSHLLLGFEIDETFPNSDVNLPPSIRGSQTVASAGLGQATYSEFVFHGGTARARVGYAADSWMVYATGGLAWTYDRVSRTQIDNGVVAAGTVDTALLWRLGWAAGAGVEIPLAQSWTMKAEFLATGFGSHTETFAAAGQLYQSSLVFESVRVGFNYHIGDGADAGNFFAKGADALEMDRFALHAQATYTQQYDPPFRAPYSGTNSLAPGIGRETFDYTIFAGMRLWQGAEAWINPEIDQGFGLSGSVGAAGFPSGEAYKVGADYPYVRLQRAFIRQTIDLGGEEQKFDAAANQFSGSQTSDRVVITVGKFGAVDVFDTNKYAHDPRGD